MTDIGTSKIWLRLCVYSFARFTYWSTISQVKQTVAWVVAPAIILGFLLSVGTAQAGGIRPESFFDFGFAKSAWNNFARQQVDDYFTNRCPAGGPDDVWKEAYKRDPQAALKALKTNPDREKIKRCYDFQLVYDQWGKIYVTWRDPISSFGSKGWNKNEPNLLCMSMSAQNIFTHKCNDLPDWRTPEEIKADNAAIADYNAREKAAVEEKQAQEAAWKAKQEKYYKKYHMYGR